MKPQTKKRLSFIELLSPNNDPFDFDSLDLITSQRAEKRFDEVNARLEKILKQDPGTRRPLLSLENETDLCTMAHIIMEKMHGSECIILFPGDKVSYSPKVKVIRASGSPAVWVKLVNRYNGHVVE